MAANSQGFRSIDEMVAKIRAMPNLVADAGPGIASEVKAVLDTTARAQQAPTGQPWAPRKQGSAPVLVRAPQAISVRALDRSIVITLSGHHVFHHYGAKGIPRRPQIPIAGLPYKLGDAIRLGLVEGWNRSTSKKYGGSGAKRVRK